MDDKDKNPLICIITFGNFLPLDSTWKFIPKITHPNGNYFPLGDNISRTEVGTAVEPSVFDSIHLVKPYGHYTTDMIDDVDDKRKEKDLGKEQSPVDSPAHYNKGKQEAIDIIEDAVLGYPIRSHFAIGNVIKYILRAPHKGKLVEDLKKARWYLDRAIKNLDG